MTWAAVCDLPFTDYQQNEVIDATSYQNNAVLLGGTIPRYKYATFQTSDDQIVIPVKDDSLQRFTALRIQAIIYPTQLPHRLNITEGWMSFAFFIEADGTLIATIFDGNKWVSITSGSAHVPMGEWSGVSFSYDGISIGKLTLNGAAIGNNLDMPMGMRQPQEQIAIGHWPKGDGRYTFTGNIGHVKIERRDYEDFGRDAWLALLCRRTFTPRQASAMKEFLVLANSVDPATREAIIQCAKNQSQKLAEVFRKLRAGQVRNIALHRQLAEQLRAAWCCAVDPTKIKEIILSFFESQSGEPGSKERDELLNAIKELLQISAMCERTDPPFDRMRELLCIAIPELSYLQIIMDQLVASI